VVETVSGEGINEKSVGFNRLVTGFADAEGAGLHSLQGGVHFAKQLSDTLGVGNGGNGRVEPFSSGQELVSQSRVSDIARGLTRLHFQLVH
jgi:hypothetical protein